MIIIVVNIIIGLLLTKACFRGSAKNFVSKVVGYYDLRVLSMSLMCFKKKVWMEGGWVG